VLETGRAALNYKGLNEFLRIEYPKTWVCAKVRTGMKPESATNRNVHYRYVVILLTHIDWNESMKDEVTVYRS
jgi:hypothetical protein